MDLLPLLSLYKCVNLSRDCYKSSGNATALSNPLFIRVLVFPAIWAVLVFTSCHTSKGTKKTDLDPSAEILERAYKQAGGLDNWRKKSLLDFTKDQTLYESNGHRESRSVKQYRIHSGTSQEIQVKWDEEDSNYHVIFVDNVLSVYKNNLLDKESEVETKASLTAAEYVASLPFKIADDGNETQYSGIDSSLFERHCYVVRMAHRDSQDIWWHYFDVEDYKHYGYKVRHLDHISLVKNLTFVNAGKFTMPQRRKSYRVDGSGKIQYLRADYFYSNYNIK